MPTRKVPQDHRPASAAEDVTGPVAVTVTYHEHEYHIPAEAFDDVEFLDAMVTVDSRNEAEASVAAFKAAKALVGPEVWDEFRANERGENGRVKASDFMEFFSQIMDAGNRKN